MIKITLRRTSGNRELMSSHYFENEHWYSAGKRVLDTVNRHSIEMDMVFTRMKNLNYNAPTTFDGDGVSLTIVKNYDRV
jgi:hypothetical protein